MPRLAPALRRNDHRPIIACATLALLALVLWWMGRDPADTEHRLDKDALVSLSNSVGTDALSEERILKHFGSLCPSAGGGWRSLPDEHRVVLISLSADWNIAGMGIASYIARSRHDPGLPRLDEAAEAYRALGQTAIAEALLDAKSSAGDDGIASIASARAAESAIATGRAATRAARAAYIADHADSLVK